MKLVGLADKVFVMWNSNLEDKERDSEEFDIKIGDNFLSKRHIN